MILPSEISEELTLLQTMQVTVVTDGTQVQEVISDANIDVSKYDELVVITDYCNGFYANSIDVCNLKLSSKNNWYGGTVNFLCGNASTRMTVGYNQTSKKLTQLVFASQAKNTVGGTATGRIFGVEKRR